MRRTIFALGLVSVVLGLVWGVAARDRADTARDAQSPDTIVLSGDVGAAGPQRGPGEIKAGTARDVGVFPLRQGRTVRLRVADTTAGQTCLVDVEEPHGARGMTCRTGGLFTDQRVVFSVNFAGGPDAFSSMYLVGVAAPMVRAVSVVKSDGSVVEADLSSDGAFVVESSAGELQRRIYPATVVAYGHGGRVIERVDTPAPG